MHTLATMKFTLAAMLVAASGAAAQVEVVARTTDDDDEFGGKPGDISVSVGEDVLVVTSNHGVTMLNRSGTILDEHKLDDAGFPFIRIGSGSGTIAPSRWFDPRTVYDPEHNRQWMLYSEQYFEVGTSRLDDISPLHLAVSRDMSGSNVLDEFDELDW